MNPIPLLTSVLFAVFVPAHTTGAPAFKSAGAFFALSVADRDESADWYIEKLGMKVVMRTPKQDGTAVTIVEGGGLIVELVQEATDVSLRTVAPQLQEKSRVHGFFKAGVIVEDFDRTIATLRERHVAIVAGPFPARADQRANAIIRDNAGNLIQFFGGYAARN